MACRLQSAGGMITTALLLFVLAADPALPDGAIVSPPADPAPPTAVSQAARIAITTSLGLATTLAGVGIGYGSFQVPRNQIPPLWLTYTGLGLGVGVATLGPGLAVGLVGNALHGNGSLWAALGGSLIGSVAGAGLLVGFSLATSGWGLLVLPVSIPLAIIVGSLPTVGAVLGYELTTHGPPRAKPNASPTVDVRFGAEPLFNPANRTVAGASLTASGRF